MQARVRSRILAAVVVGAALAGIGSAARAAAVRISVGLPLFVGAAPVYVAPQPVYVAPPPPVVVPHPVVVGPYPVYAAPARVVYVNRYPAHWGHERGRDDWRHSPRDHR